MRYAPHVMILEAGKKYHTYQARDRYCSALTQFDEYYFVLWVTTRSFVMVAGSPADDYDLEALL